MSSRPTAPAQRAAPRPRLCASPPTRAGKREPSVSPGTMLQLPVAKTRRPRRASMVTHYNKDGGIKSPGTFGDYFLNRADLSGLEEEQEGLCDDENLALGPVAAHEDSGLGLSVTNDSKVSRSAGDEGFDVPGSSIRSCPGSDGQRVAWVRKSLDLDDSPFLPAVTSSWKRDDDSVDSAKSRRQNFSAGDQSTLDELLGKKGEGNDSHVETKRGNTVDIQLLDVTGHSAVPDTSLFSPVAEKRGSGIGLVTNPSVLDYDESDTSGHDCLDGARPSMSPLPQFLKTPQPNRKGRGRSANSMFPTPVTALTRTFSLELSSPSGSSWCSPSLGDGHAVPGSPAEDDETFSCVFSDRRCVVTEGGSDTADRSFDASGDDLTPELCKRSHRLGRLKRLSTIREGGSQSDGDNVAVPQHREAAALVSASRRRQVSERGRQKTVAGSRVDSVRDAAACTPPLGSWRDVTPPPSAVVSADAAHTPALRLAQETAWRFRKGLQETTPVGASSTTASSGWKHSPAQLNEVMKLALAAVPVAVRDSPSLKQLIGRKMGCKCLDIIAELEKRNLKHVLWQLLGHLSLADRDRARRVSAVWCSIVEREQALGRWAAEETPKLVPLVWQKENTPDLSPDVAGTRQHQAGRPALSSLQCLGANAAAVPRSSPLVPLGLNHAPPPPPAPTKCRAVGSRASSLHERFVEVGRTLDSDELLCKCLRCQSPARLRIAEERAVCTRESCAYDFCAICRCQWHGARPCSPAQPVRHGPKAALPGTKQSKRNLKRL